MSRYDELIERLALTPHPEGGYYREIYRSGLSIPAEHLPSEYGSPRRLATMIYFLIPAGGGSALHRVRSEECWVFLEGDPITLRARPQQDAAPTQSWTLHSDLRHAIIPARWWQEATVAEGESGYALVMCLVAPGFEFDDFALAQDEAASTEGSEAN